MNGYPKPTELGQSGLVQIERLVARLREAGNAAAVARAVSELGRDELNLVETGVTWCEPAQETWWVRAPHLLRRMLDALRDDHGPVFEPPGRDGLHKALLPVVEPEGLLGAICCANHEAFSATTCRDLMTLALHVSVRVTQFGTTATSELVLGQLTPRQAEVALLAARGRTNAGIAGALALSENTVKKHLKDIFGTLGVTNRTELAVRLHGHGSELDGRALRAVGGE